MDFKTLGLIGPILKALAAQGYSAPTPIQEKAIPPALAGRDVLGCAQTGTGKTCAFAAPILQLLSGAQTKGRPIRALVLTPTRELALQIFENFEAYGTGLPLRSAVIFGGVGQNPQAEKLRQGVDILTATPGRLLDLHGQGLVDLSHVEIFVLDEADRMLDMGFIHDVRRVLKLLPGKKQTLFFSATMPPEVASLVDELLKDPVRVAVDPVSSPVEVIKQSVYLVDRGNKTKLLAKLLADLEIKNALVFTRTKHGANKVAGDLEKMGIPVAAIHGNKSQTARQQALADFKEGRLKVLVATDIAARGLDIEELSYVFNYNLPEVPETYIHRIGRTGRAGRGGTAVSFCDCAEQASLKAIEKLLGRRLPLVENHDWPMTVFETTAKDGSGRSVNPDDAEARAAARERRRDRETRNTEKARPAEQKAATSAVKKTVEAEPEAEPAKKRRRPKKNRASSLSELMKTAEPVRERQEPTRYSDFQKPDPLAGNVIMDATARLLAPRPRPVQPGAPKAAEEPRRQQQAPAAKQAAPARQTEAPAQRKPGSAAQGHRRQRNRAKPTVPAAAGGDKRHRRNGPPPVELRKNGQKDSTEQPSLMKPYYLERD